MKTINLYWFKFKEGNGNFGDELNHYIISKLTGCEINHIIIPTRGFHYIYECLRLIYKKVVPIKDIQKLVKQFFINDFIVGIGSVIALPNNSKVKIWGSGIIKKDDIINEAEFYAVRGFYTQKRLVELGLPAPITTGDPALLLPLIYKASMKKKYKLGIIPHFIHYKSISKKFNCASILIIDLLDPIEKIIDEIASCEFTISTSLHGIIVSHVYNIPSLWYTYSDKHLAGDNIKFYDYFSTVGIEEYIPFPLKILNFDLDIVIQRFDSYSQVSVINKELYGIQKQLIDVAPFPILDCYKNDKINSNNS